MCAHCRRPVSVCYCHALPRIETATRVVILQHPRERDMPIGTARMASLCLPQAELHVGVRWAGEPLAGAIGDPARPPILLYPGPGARDILREPPRGPVTLVVVDGTWSQARSVVRDNPVLQALPRYAFATPELSHYRIRREPRAEYVSTIEALMHVLGVLEGDPARFRRLLDPLRAMVDAQLACQASSARRAGVRQVHRPRPPRRVVPEAIAGRFDDLVCVVGEANAWPYDGRRRPARHDRRPGRDGGDPRAPYDGESRVALRDESSVALRDESRDELRDEPRDELRDELRRERRDESAGERRGEPRDEWRDELRDEPRDGLRDESTGELRGESKDELRDESRDELRDESRDELRDEPRDEVVHWVAHRVATGETFELIVAPAGPLSPSTAFHIELAEAAIRGGEPRGELGARFARFSRPTDLLCAWGHHGLDLAIAGGVAPAERLDLRAAAHRVANRKLGSLEGYAATIAPPPAPLAAGRAGRRLALLVQIVRAWRAAAGP